MKTPIQEAIKMVQDYRKSGFADATTCNNILLHLGLILKQEKEVIMDAYMAGESDATHKIDSALNYYNVTFNTKEK